MPRLLIATHNRGKVKEYAEMMSGLSVEPISLDEAGITTDVEETGDTFEENARIKALAYARLSGLLTLADDSGLEVDALGGAPGVQSARYAGPGASDADRYRLLLENLEGIPPNRRTARFRCVLALATPQGEVRVVHGTVEGVIADGPRGSHGFGYDPVFYMPEHGATMAELGPEIKNTISHRARAFQAILPILRALIDP
jgi:XTP/dITP diphosphohydrolase